MHWLEILVDVFGDFFLHLARICLGENLGWPGTVIGWIALLLAILIIVGIMVLAVRLFFFSK